MAREWKKIEKGIYVVGDNVFFRMMVDGKREMEKAPMQGALALDSRGRPTKDLRKAFLNWKMKLVNREYVAAGKGAVVPTFGDILRVYEDAADRQRVKTGKPGVFSEYTVKKNFRRVYVECGFSDADRSDKLTEQVIDDYVYRMIKEGLKPITAWSYVDSVRSICAAWTVPYFEAAGFSRPTVRIPSHNGRQSARYKRLPEETKKKILAWYGTLWERNPKWWFFATMMLLFAQRDGDVFANRIGENLYRDREGRMWLDYVPHKTSKSSGRRVKAVVPDDVADRIDELTKGMANGTRIVWKDAWDALDDVARHGAKHAWLKGLNASLRQASGLEGSKALYELRKLCVDHYYRTKGAEAAVAISGDDIKTISYFYLDPSGVGTDTPVTAADIL